MEFATNPTIQSTTLRCHPRLDAKRDRIDFQEIIGSADRLVRLWNDFVRSHEISTPNSTVLLNENGALSKKGVSGKFYCGLKALVCACCDGICGPNSGCNCEACHKLDEEADLLQLFHEKEICSEYLLNSWTWINQPNVSELKSCLGSIVQEQLKLCVTASTASISMTELKQKLLILKRYLIAVKKSNKFRFLEADNIRDERSNVSKQSYHSHEEENSTNCNCLANNLTKIGLKTALNFAFAFLQRSWKTGEDTDSCQFLLSELFESIQSLPIASLFDYQQLPSLWLDTITRVETFLKKIIYDEFESNANYRIPIAEKRLTVSIMFELILQKANLSAIIDFVITLMNLWALNSTEMSSKRDDFIEAPFITSLRRLQSVDSDNSYSVKTPIGSFLYFNQLPVTNDTLITFNWTAVFLMCHLSRLANPLMIQSSKLRNQSKQNLISLGSISCCNYFVTEGDHEKSRSILKIREIVCSKTCCLILSEMGLVYVMNYATTNCLVQPVSGFGSRLVTKLASNPEGNHFLALTECHKVYSWGNGDVGKLGHNNTDNYEEPALIQHLADKNIVSIACGSSYSAAISDNGILYTWGRASYGRLGHGTIEDCLIPTPVEVLKGYYVTEVACGSGDAHTLCTSREGIIFSWGDGDYGKLGRGGSVPSKLPKIIENLRNEFITKVYCGSQFSVALTRSGQVYSWGKGEDFRLGHEHEEHIRFPKLIKALKNVKIVQLSVASTHVLALSDDGDVYGWGKNDQYQISNCVESVIRRPTLISHSMDLKACNIATGSTQSFIWSAHIQVQPEYRLLFVLELSHDIFLLLEKLLKLVCDQKTDSCEPLSQVNELIAIVVLDLLQLHFNYVINQNESPSHYHLDSNKSLTSLIISLATGPNVLKTVQMAAQTTLNAGWKLLLISVDERIKTLSDILSGANDNYHRLTYGENFLIDLLISTLISNEDLETIFLADALTNFSIINTLTHQLIRCGSQITENKLTNFKNVTVDAGLSPILNLTLNLQRIMFRKVFENHNWHQKLLISYLEYLCDNCIRILTAANHIVNGNQTNMANVYKTLKCSILDVLLPEMMLNLILLHHESQLFFNMKNFATMFMDLLQQLDLLCKKVPTIYKLDDNDLNFNTETVFCKKPNSLLQFITKAEFQNQALENRNWILVHSFVYDVGNFKTDYKIWSDFLEANKGMDVTKAFSMLPFNHLLIRSLEPFKIGTYWPYDISEHQLIEEVCPCLKILLNVSRQIAYLLGYHAFSLFQSLPVQSIEKNLNTNGFSVFLSAGLQHFKVPDPFKEDKCDVRSSNSTSDNTPTDWKRHIDLKLSKNCFSTDNILNSFIYGLAESRLSDRNVAIYLALIEQYCKSNNFLSHADFTFDHPVEEIGRVLHATIIFQQGLGFTVLTYLTQYNGNQSPKLPNVLVDLIKLVHNTKWNLIKCHQESNRSYKELCVPIFEKCRFLLYDLQAVVNPQKHAFKKVNVLHKTIKFRKYVRQVMKLNGSYKRRSIANDPSKRNKSCDDFQIKNSDDDLMKYKRLSNSLTLTNNRGEFQQNLDYILNKINEKSMLEGQNSQKHLMYTIVDFVTKNNETPNDIVNTLHRVMLNHVERYQIRKSALDLLTQFLSKNHFLSSIVFAIFDGFFAIFTSNYHFKDYDTFANCSFITPVQKIDLMLAKAHLTDYCTDLIRFVIRMHETTMTTATATATATAMNSNLNRDILKNRYLLVAYTLLSISYPNSNELNYLLNNGALSSTLYILRHLNLDRNVLERNSSLYHLYTLPDDSIRNNRKINELSSCDVAVLMKKGTRVIRGPDWKWGEQDAPHPGEGCTLNDICADGWVRVEWDNGSVNSYRMGRENKFDLALAPSSSDGSSEGSTCVKHEDNNESRLTFSDLLKDVCINFMLNVVLSIGVHSNTIEQISLRNFCNLLKDVIFKSHVSKQNSWYSLTLALSICQSDRIKEILSHNIWINSLFGLVEFRRNRDDRDLVKQMLALKLIKVIISSWPLDSDKIQPVMERLLTILGHLALTCIYDKNMPNSEPKILYVQSYTSSLCREIVNLIRHLHQLPGWNQCFNGLLSDKLKCIQEYLDPSIHLNVHNADILDHNDQHLLVFGILNVLGAKDSRLRLGAKVTSDNDNENGTVIEITKGGQFLVQLMNSTTIKHFEIADVIVHDDPDINFNQINFCHSSIQIWTTLLLLPLHHFDFRKSLNSNCINVSYLRYQQFQISSLSASQLILQNQHRLRKVLKHQTAIARTNELENEPQLTTFQKVLKKAIQPISLRDRYSVKDLYLAALDLSQHLVLQIDQNTRKNLKPLMNQLIEMGFSKANIELGSRMFVSENNHVNDDNVHLEKMITWLLNNSEETLTKNLRSSLCKANDEIESGTRSSPSLTLFSKQFKTRSDFPSNSDYAHYVSDNVQIDMMVKSIKNFDKVQMADVGIVQKIDKEALHNLNLQIYWQRINCSIWVRFISIELLGFPLSTKSTEIKVGDKVKVRNDVIEPKHKWGLIDGKNIGTVKAISSNGIDVWVDFANHSNWWGEMSELTLVNSESLVCNICNAALLELVVYKCQVCCNYVLCEPCFLFKKLHWHSFDRINENGGLTSAGHPGRLEKNSDITNNDIYEWNKCVQFIYVSSNQSSILGNMLCGPWRSYGNKGPNWIRLMIHANILISKLTVHLDPSNFVLLPRQIDINGGPTFNHLKKINTIEIRKNDKMVTLISNLQEHFTCIEIAFVQCWNDKNDCKIQGLIINSWKKADSSSPLMKLLADDFEVSNDTNIYKPLPIDDDTSKIYVWGLNDRDQLGGDINGSQIRTPTLADSLKKLHPVFIAGGAKSLFIISQEGKLFSSGEGLHGRSGLSHQCNVSRPTLVATLSQHVMKKVAVHSCGRHSLAITIDGKIFSWGEGDDGRLGHGNRLNLDTPKQIDFFHNKKVFEISCGTSHSAAITSNGELYTWGLGDFGRLGHGDDITQLLPKLVKALIGKNVVKVACGGRDAQTLALLDTGVVYSWGDADFGKLGRCSSETNYLPEIIDTLASIPIINIECGAQFSVALSASGNIYTWGRGDYFRLGHGSDQHIRKPTIIESLCGKNVVKIAVGALHCLALTAKHQVFVWGDNDHGQQGDGTVTANKTPSMVLGMDEDIINEIACGSSHCIAWHSLLPAHNAKHEPVIFENVKDSLGASLLHFYDKETTDTVNHSVQNCSNIYPMSNYPLGELVLSIDNNFKKQQALQFIIETIQIQQSRQCVIKALISHKIAQELASNDMITSDTEIEDLLNKSSSESDDNLQQIWNMSSCSASVSSKHSKLSTGAMSAVATTLTSNADILGDLIGNGLDDFTCLLNEKDMIDLLALLKLAMYDRVESSDAKETLSSVLIGLANYNTSFRSILVEYCITELNNVANEWKICQERPKPVVQESSHPYTDEINIHGQVTIPTAESLRVEFDPRCSTERRQDCLEIKDESGRLITSCSGREWFDWPEVIVPGNELQWSFSSDSSINGWGWKFTVYPIMKNENKSNESDRIVLCQASIQVVISLYNDKLFANLNCHSINRFISALAASSRLSTLSISQRIWTLKTLHNCLLLYFKKSQDISSILEYNWQTNSLMRLINELPEMLLIQYEYEDFSVRSGRHLMHSEFFKVLVSLACDLLLDLYPAIRESHNWSWFIRYCTAFKVAKSMINRTQLPAEFLEEVQEKVNQIHLVDDENHVNYTSQQVFKKEHDEQLLMWLSRRPNDWTMSTSGSASIYGWGHNHRGQLGGIDGIKVKLPTICESLSTLRISQIAGGEQTLFAVTVDGKVYCSGLGTTGRLGIGCSESVQVPTLIESLVHVFIRKIAVNAGGHHCLALTNDNQVYSWGEGDDGKLGHGDRIYYDRPKLIEALKPHKIVDIACGGHHSAAITNKGQLFTWGKGRYGRLGHGDSEDHLVPKIVEVLNGYKVIDVACGCGDSQTLCITDDDNVWSWGDGDYGKLGRGGSEGCKVPIKIDSLAGLGVSKVECGSQFSIAMTRSGSIYTWGKGDYHRLGHGNIEHVRRPKKVSALHGKRVVSLAIGSLHCIVCTDKGEVCTWGDNDEGQLGDGTTNAIPRPRVLRAFQNIKVTNVACGSAHTIAWSVTQMEVQRILPTKIPLEYDLLTEFAPTSSYCRLILLHSFSELISPYISMLPTTGSISLNQLRTLLAYTVKESMFRKVVQATMVRDKQHGPVVELNRLQIKRLKSKGGLAGVDGMKSVFGQMVSKLPLLKSDSLLLPHRVWKVKFVGESVDDCGGGFSESIAEMCDELQNGSVPLLILSPNGRDDNGTSRDCFILNSSLTSVLHLNMFRFLGVLMAIAIRTGSPLSLSVAEPIWKLLCGLELNPNDLTEIDKDFVPSLLCIKHMDVDEKEFQFLEMPFSTTSTGSVPILLSSKYKYITLDNRLEYIKLALDYRLHEFDEQVKAVRDGMSKVIPVPLLSLFTAYELEVMVCGSPEIPISMLKSVATYKGIESSSPLIQWFWEVMESFTNQERSLFLRFVWGRTRLPRTIADFRGRDFVIQVMDKYNPPDYFLPESYTCFFLLKMPKYSSKLILREKLKYAIHFCKSIDTDEYARVAITSDREMGYGTESNSLNSDEVDLDVF